MSDTMVGRLRVRDPKEPLTDMEKRVFGNVRQHPITGYPLEVGCTDHSLTVDRAMELYGSAPGQPPSDNKQAVGHFMLMIGDMHKLCNEHANEADPRKKAQLLADHTVTAEHVATVAQALIDQRILNTNALALIPQL
jgi:hypothetical protein